MEIQKLHEEAWSLLSEERKRDPQLRFKPRLRNVKRHLQQGLWFIGNDKYFVIGLAEGADAREKVHSIGFAVEAGGKCYLKFSAEDARKFGDNSTISLLRNMATRLSTKDEPMLRVDYYACWEKVYKGKWQDALLRCLREDLPVILDSLDRAHNPKIQRIDNADFLSYVAEIERYRVIQNKIVRLAYNTNGWVRPSGAEGKSKNVTTYEAGEGFAHEEWLFSPHRDIEGYRYGYLQPVLAGWRTHEGKIYNMALYTIAPDGRYIHVANIKEVECITSEIALEAYHVFQQKGWIKEMADEVEEVGGQWESILESDENLFNVRYRPENLSLIEKTIDRKKDKNITAKYYTTMLNQKSEFCYIPPLLSHVQPHRKGVQVKNDGSTLRKTTQKMTVVDLQHNRMQNALKKYLESTGKYRKGSIQMEENYIDLSAYTVSGDVHIFELKTGKSAARCIREALGQILEYNHYYSSAPIAKKLYIISTTQPLEEDKLYLQKLRMLYNLPIWYRTFTTNPSKLGPEY